MVFGPLPKTDSVPAMPTLILDHGDVGFAPFIDDHIGAATSFEAMFRFLHEKYFPRIVFGPCHFHHLEENLGSAGICDMLKRLSSDISIVIFLVFINLVSVVILFPSLSSL